jgi:RHH-type proline utilization regulon transcriptional repressor/proline dehydrogenase/delta 1-pyrroline-5-carboxylate dehydrogenase
VDSTALPEQAVQAIVESAFQSAGQRCSALRCLYVQEDIAESFTTMLTGAMNALVIADPWTYGTDVGPPIGADRTDLLHSDPRGFMAWLRTHTLSLARA